MNSKLLLLHSKKLHAGDGQFFFTPTALFATPEEIVFFGLDDISRYAKGLMFDMFGGDWDLVGG